MVSGLWQQAFASVSQEPPLRKYRASGLVHRQILLLAIGFVLHGWVCAAADILVLSNGDQLKGEVKKLEKEVVVFKTDYSDEDFKIKWKKVVQIKSDRTFTVEKFSGERISGPLDSNEKAPAKAEVAAKPVALPEIAFIRPFEQKFWSRIDWGFDLGYSMTKANGVKQLTAGTEMQYTAPRDLVSLSSNAFFNQQENAPRTRRWQVDPAYKRLIGRAWYASAAASLFSSEEQQLSLRGTYGGGIGRYFLRSPKRHLALGSGLAYTRERYFDPALPIQNSTEAYFGAEYRTERFKLTDIVTRFVVYPSLTIHGRFRTNYQLDLDFNLPGDWYMKTGYYNNFDSAPPAALPRLDYGWRNSFGYKF